MTNFYSLLEDIDEVPIPWWRRNALPLYQLSSLIVFIIGTVLIFYSEQKGLGMVSKNTRCNDYRRYIRHVHQDDCYKRICRPSNHCIEYGFGYALIIYGIVSFFLTLIVSAKQRNKA